LAIKGKDIMKVLVVGGGGREHALCRKLAESPALTTLYAAPGNAGIAEVATCVPIKVEDIQALVAFATENAIDLVVIGPEVPLVLGLADRLRAINIPVFGPSQAAARLEGSKGFMKDVVAKAGIPTAWYQRFTDADAAKAFIREKGAPIVVKTDGLAAGKGVVVAMTLDEALTAVDKMMGEKIFGDAGNELVIEEFLDGEEASLFAICDGKTAVFAGAAQDHKRVGDGDTGPNTGGMGAYSPAPILTPALERSCMDLVFTPALRAMAEAGSPFIGILFAGLMITKDGPKLLEFNVRYGDPETQVLMARITNDLLPVLLAAATGDLGQSRLDWSNDAALVVVMAAKGYPEAYTKNTRIENLAEAAKVEGVSILHAGTQSGPAGAILAVGGRVLGITATGSTVEQAQHRAYQAIDLIHWPEGFCRRDIGWRAIGR